MSKVELEIEDLEEFITAYNNAYICLHSCFGASFFGVIQDNIPGKLYDGLIDKLGTDDPKVWAKYFEDKLKALKKVYDQLLEIEKNEQNKGD